MNNFDFLVGTWDSTHRKLKKRLVGCTDWAEFTGTTRCFSFLDGAANIDEIYFPETGNRGLTVRLYDAETDHWPIYWVDSRAGVMGLPPVVGRFEDGVSTFYSDER